MNRFLTVSAMIICVILLCSCGPDAGKGGMLQADDISEYDKTLVTETYGDDLDSDLSIFPDDVPAKDASYTAHFRSNLFDTDGRMILDCIYDNARFDDEIRRLQGLSKTIVFHDEQYTNEIMYDEESYAYPAYIAIDGFGNTYEYALIDRDGRRITYLYLAYPSAEILRQYRDYVKKDLAAYEEENTQKAFSMYNHSFDGGDSWIEYSDIGN